MEAKPLPDKLYQYQPCNELTMSNLINSAIHLGSPARFNDPFDCTFTFSPPKPNQIPMLREMLEQDEPDPFPDNDEDFTELLKSMHNPIYNHIRTKTINKLGVCCLSEIHPEAEDSFLMWSHYADKHKGFCLEFNTMEPPFSTADYVDYEDSFPSVDIHQMMVEDAFSQSERKKCIGTKSKHWKYEREWRIFAKNDGFEEYSRHQLSAVYFGCKTGESELNAIARTLEKYRDDTQLFLMKPLTDAYRLQAMKLEYRS